MQSIIYGDNINPAAYDLISRFLHSQPNTSLRFLEFGCSTGALGHKILSTHKDIHWIGIDYNASALEIAKTRLSSVHKADLNHFDDELISACGHPDFIVMVDVLEHVYEPNIFLQSIRDRFPVSKIICVLPNISSFQTYDQIAQNDFEYAQSGIFDCTHKTFFTSKSAVRFFSNYGYRILSDIIYLIDPSMMHIYQQNNTFPFVYHSSNYSFKAHNQSDLLCFCSYGFGLAFEPIA